ncbi:RNA-directed DNA polymerase, eukaryota [Tanacetum coccineum]
MKSVCFVLKSKKIPWISWNLVLASKENGGLGVWGRIVGTINSLHDKGIIPHSFLKRRINNGASTRFWHETWINSTPLRQQYPRLFHLALNKNCSIQDCWNNGWSLEWSRSISSGANAFNIANLYNQLANYSLNDSDDDWTWDIGMSTFTVKHTREYIDQSYLPNDGMETRWNRFLPKKINIFIWRSLRDRLPTRWNLSRKGIDIDSLSCPICDTGIETIHHTLWTCSLATTVWHRIFSWLQIPPPTLADLHDLYSWVDDLHISSSRRIILDTICGVVLWSLWNFRNETIFGTTPPKRCLLIDKIVDFSYSWYSSRNKLSPVTWNNWIQNPLEISSL